MNFSVHLVNVEGFRTFYSDAPTTKTLAVGNNNEIKAYVLVT